MVDSGNSGLLQWAGLSTAHQSLASSKMHFSFQGSSVRYGRGIVIGQGRAERGDTVCLPEELGTSSLRQSATDWILLLHQRQAGPTLELRRFGADLISDVFDSRGADLRPLVPADHVVVPGDEMLLTLWGSVDADLRLLVGRSGRITTQQVGPVRVSGVRHADLTDVLPRRVAQMLKPFQISRTLGQIQGIRVFVTGFFVKPDAYTVSSLATVVAAMMRAGGPAAAVSFRSIKLRRGGAWLSNFDLYDLLHRGDRSANRIVQSGNVVHVGAVGVQVGFFGSVNKPTVLEPKPGETVADTLRIAGGFSAVADRGRLAVERLQDRNASRVAQLALPVDLKHPLGHGDMSRAFRAVNVALSSQSKRVRVQGEVIRLSEYVSPGGGSIGDAQRAAGDLTLNAYGFATEFNRESVRASQQENYDRAQRDLETDFARNTSSHRGGTADEVSSEAASASTLACLLERLRELRLSGRIVLQLLEGGTRLPNQELGDGDRVYSPGLTTTVGVFGSVLNAAGYLYLSGRTLVDYLRPADSQTKGGDEANTFVVRADGSVVSNRQSASWFGRGSELGAMAAEAGDNVFVPEEMNKTTFVQSAKDRALFLYQRGIGIAGMRSAVK